MVTENSKWAESIQIAADLCVKFEGLILKPYICPAGVATIGVGATFYQDGRKVTLQDPPITKDAAMDLLKFHLEQVFLPSVFRQCPILANEKSGRIAAILDFAFNAGTGRLQTSTLKRKINALEWEQAKEQLMLWNKGGGKVLSGLTKRRIAECALLN
jgi:lysozyme